MPIPDDIKLVGEFIDGYCLGREEDGPECSAELDALHEMHEAWERIKEVERLLERQTEFMRRVAILIIFNDLDLQYPSIAMLMAEHEGLGAQCIEHLRRREMPGGK